MVRKKDVPKITLRFPHEPLGGCKYRLLRRKTEEPELKVGFGYDAFKKPVSHSCKRLVSRDQEKIVCSEGRSVPLGKILRITIRTKNCLLDLETCQLLRTPARAVLMAGGKEAI